MKRLLLGLLIVRLFASCTKTDRIKPRAYLHLKIAGSGVELIWEEVDGEWKSKSKAAKLYASSQTLSQFSLNLQNITGTGHIPNVSIKEINYTDELFFRPDKVLNGYIVITRKDDHLLTGEFDVELESHFRIAEKRRIIGSFRIYDR
jgi:hypothetical protein